MCGGQLCRCDQDSGRGKPLHYGKTGVCSSRWYAVPLLCGTQPGRYVARPMLCYSLPLHGCSPAPQLDSLHFLWVTIQCRWKAMQILFSTRLRFACAVLIGAVPGRRKTALLQSLSVLIPSEAFLRHTLPKRGSALPIRCAGSLRGGLPCRCCGQGCFATPLPSSLSNSDAGVMTPHPAQAPPDRLAVPGNCCGLTLILAVSDRCGNSGFAYSATGSAKPQFPSRGRQ